MAPGRSWDSHVSCGLHPLRGEEARIGWITKRLMMREESRNLGSPALTAQVGDGAAIL